MAKIFLCFLLPVVVWKLLMNEVARTAAGRRHVQDGTYTVLLLALAVVQGYVLLPTATTTTPAAVSMVVTQPSANHVSPVPSTMARQVPEAAIVPTTTTLAPAAPAPPVAT